MRLLTPILLCTLLSKTVNGGICESIKDIKDIDATKLHGTWYAVADIPRNVNTLCWNFGEFRQVQGGFKFTTHEHEFGNFEDNLSTRHEFVRVSEGYYLENSTYRKTLNEELEPALRDSTWQDTLGQIRKDEPKFDHLVFFLTDYERYFILVLCDDPEWHAYIKSPTQEITIEFLEEVYEVLDGIGPKSPIMTLETGCMRNKFGRTC